MTEEAAGRAIEDARRANTELHIRDSNGKVFQNNFENPSRGEEEEELEKIGETSELDLLSNLSSSTEIEQETKEHNLRRSKRVTKTNPIVRPKNPVPSVYMKNSQKIKQPGNNSRYPRKQLTTYNARPCPDESNEDRTITMDTARNTEAKQCLGRSTAFRDNNTPPLVNCNQIIEGGIKSKKNIVEDKHSIMRHHSIYIICLMYLLPS